MTAEPIDLTPPPVPEGPFELSSTGAETVRRIDEEAWKQSVAEAKEKLLRQEEEFAATGGWDELASQAGKASQDSGTSRPEVPGGLALIPPPPADENEDSKEKQSISTQLVAIAQSLYDLGVTPAGDTFAVAKSGPRLVHPLRGGRYSLRKLLAKEFFLSHQRAATQNALADALNVLEGFAQEEEPTELAVRVARIDGAVYVDMGDTLGRAIRITQAGWDIDPYPPVLFRRTELTGVLPVPTGGGNLDNLWQFINVSEEDRPLLAAHLVASLFPDIPHPAPALLGEQGTGKTTAHKVLVLLIDPGPVPARKAPKDPEGWVTAAAGSWVVGLDNLSGMQDWLSDSICRAVTGDGDVRRKLFTDGDLAVFSFRRIVVLNGIDLGALRGDLADRLIPFRLERIADGDRLEEEDIWPAFHKAHPDLLGAVLDLAVKVLAALPTVKLEAKPRMADFARILAAVDDILGTDGFGTYLERQVNLAADSLSADEFISAVTDTLADDTFEGTAKKLLEAVTPDDMGWRAPKGWPTNGRAVTTVLRRQAPVMRKDGWVVEDLGADNKAHATIWRLTPPREKGWNPASLTSPDSPEAAMARLASKARNVSGTLTSENPASQQECPAGSPPSFCATHHDHGTDS